MSASEAGQAEVGANPDFERRWWRVQQGVWVVLGLFVLATLAGLLGRGPLSHATADAPGGEVGVEYERFGRRAAPLVTKVHVGRGLLRAGQVRVTCNGPFADGLRLQTVTPAPLLAEPLADGTPVLVYADGAWDDASMKRLRLQQQDVLSAARQQGYERMEQVKYAVAERNGGISIIAQDDAK